MPTDSASASTENPLERALDLLIEQNQKLFEIYDARRASADAKAAGILTADVAVGAAAATALTVIKHVTLLLLIGLLGLLALLGMSVAWVVYTGSVAGLRAGTRPGSERLIRLLERGLDKLNGPFERLGGGSPLGQDSPLLSTESTDYRHAVELLDEAASAVVSACGDGAGEAITVRLRTLEMWQIRRKDAHRLAQAKDRGVGAAGLSLGVALLFGTIVFAVYILWQRA